MNKDKLSTAWGALLDHLEAEMKFGRYKNTPGGGQLTSDHLDTLREHFGVEKSEPEVKADAEEKTASKVKGKPALAKK